MPELPEVETVMRGMRARLEGHTVASVALHRADLRWPVPREILDVLPGRRIEGFARRGKYILIRLGGGWTVLLHLGMSGRVVLGVPGRNDPPESHEHVVIETRDGARVGLVDPRRFGALDLIETAREAEHRLLAAMGIEPLGPDFTPAFLLAAFTGRRAPVKSLLLDQRIVAGLGNIYVCEALYRARIHPAEPAGVLGAARVAALVDAARAVLEEAIAAGGSSLRDYVQPDGELGYFQHAWRVYGREGRVCGDHEDGSARGTACPGVVRAVQSGRSSFFCPTLQVLSSER
ncbi:bifunctional DNA-formamidopyrimidine glycosylase/DNA-(apurinic or apyrimidinic site) lyase [Ameyamaea chiangmaiensis]|uniref:Formamidopyrimidine-DNA glycosylase n=1 Tax=Ameyamaea chiangmaiensis TaxID=442969 RepID=A0A850PEA7_9PROT|nr:bifunctional DNA-formamidopyrimidine glycosylase/DNA-(apurinic or apyrimidinic site) lyase [Ameyamaea chiangmaiensis]MBS4073631.1 bifunctional DNA-formamidopyrimidine glycosylase/DNA-(apurinic or apyrimidinic site) lyase [Ameyamaea chiangmaiensis]NVN41203.1 bifunctional DNA-formamidopyrimidine glycosylase/DNA-(apurinic or apyrimidinic site) lyase [Ameyamaea chiangmaiensis]